MLFLISRGSLKKKKKAENSDEFDEKSDTPKKTTVPKKSERNSTSEEPDLIRKKSYKKRETKKTEKDKNHKNKHSQHKIETNLRKSELTHSDPDLRTAKFNDEIDLNNVDEIQSNLLQFHLAQTDDMWPL